MHQPRGFVIESSTGKQIASVFRGLASLYLAASSMAFFAAEPCEELPIFIESKASSKADAKHGYPEFLHDDPPLIHYYLNKTTSTVASSQVNWNGEAYQPPPATGGSFWHAGATHTGASSSTYSATHVLSTEACTGEESHAFSGSRSISSSDTRVGTYFIRNLWNGVWWTAFASSESETYELSESLSYDYGANGESRGRWQGSITETYDITWQGAPPNPSEAFPTDDEWVTETEYFIDEVDIPLVPPAEVDIESRTRMTITGPPPPGGSYVTTIELSGENTTDLFVDCIRSTLPGYPQNPQDWLLQQSTAKLELNQAETATDQYPDPTKAQKYKFQLKVGNTEGKNQYRARWREVTVTDKAVSETKFREGVFSGSGILSTTQEFEVDLPVRKNQQTRVFGFRAALDNGCVSCGDSESMGEVALPGTGVLEGRGVYVRLSLGRATYGDNAGEILISDATISKRLLRPECVQVTTARDDVQVEYAGGHISRVVTPKVVVEVDAIDEYRFKIRFKHPEDGSATSGLVIRDWDFDGENPGQYIVRETIGGNERTFTFTANSGPGGSVSTLEFPDNLRREEFSSVSFPSAINGITTTETYKVFTGDTVTFQNVKVYRIDGLEDDNWREVLISETSGDKTTFYDYYEGSFSDGNTAAPIKTILSSDGSWKHFQYVGDSRVANEYSPALNESLDLENLDSHRRTQYGYTPLFDGDDGSHAPWKPRSIEVYAPTGNPAFGMLPVSGRRFGISSAVTREQVPLSGDFFNPQTVLETLSFHGDENQSTGTFYSDGTATWASVEHDETGRLRILERGVPNPNGGATEAHRIIDGTRTEFKVDYWGAPLFKVTKDIATDTVIAREDYSIHDQFGRPQRIQYLDLSITDLTYDCCGISTFMDRDKVFTETILDPLRRPQKTIRFGVTTETTFDALGRALKVERKQGANAEILGQLSYNLSGDLRFETNSLGGVIEHGEMMQGNRLLLGKTNYATGAIRNEIYNRAGTLAEVDGTGVAPLKFFHGIETVEILGHEDLFGKPYVQETRVTAAGLNEWSKTYYNYAGFPIKRLYSAAPGESTPVHSFSYNNKGQLEKEVDPDGVTTFYVYNTRGELETTGIDMPNGQTPKNGLLDLHGADRIAKTVRRFVLDPTAGPVYEVESSLWLTSGSSAETVVQIAREAPNGLNAWHILKNGGNSLTTHIARTIADATGQRTQTTTYPDNSKLIEVIQRGRIVSRTRRTADGTPIQVIGFAYDHFGRLDRVTDSQNGTTTQTFGSGDLLLSTLTAVPGPGYAAQLTSYFYDKAGRLKGVVEPDSTWSTNFYFPSDLLQKTYGSRTYPVEYTYDAQGRMGTMTTWRSFSAGQGQTPATTLWTYDQYSGLLKTKSYAGSAGPTFKYTAAGRLKERHWVRTISSVPVKSFYTYTDAGDLDTVTYNDSVTPSVDQNYDRAGRLKTVTHDGTITLNYKNVGALESEVYAGGTLGSRTVTHGYNESLLLRSSLQMNTDADTHLAYLYDTASRLTNVATASGVYHTGFFFDSTSPLLKRTISRQNSTHRLTVIREYDALNRIRQITSTPGASAPWSFTSIYNNANERTKTQLRDLTEWNYGRDALGQLTSAKHSYPDGTFVAGQQFEYVFDSIGNRTSAKRGGNSSGGSLREATYTPNLKNQYDQRTVPPYSDIVGLATDGGTVTIDGSTSGVERRGDYFRSERTVSNAGAAQYPSVQVQLSAGASPPTRTGNIFVPGSPETYTHDLDGNLKTDGRWTYTWDAENRLTKIESLASPPSGSARRIEFKYDWRGRRIYKKETNLGTGAFFERKYVYDGWNLYAELDGAGTVINTYLWGDDLSGSGQGAGGVGGLVGVKPRNGPVHFVAYDGNGNVTGLVDGSTGLTSASYEYGPFGELIRVTGPVAQANPFRFSTKYTDATTGLLYYGYRYYNPDTGRWLNRDPLDETFELSLYAFNHNAPLEHIDPDGQHPLLISSAIGAGIGAAVGAGVELYHGGSVGSVIRSAGRGAVVGAVAGFGGGLGGMAVRGAGIGARMLGGALGSAGGDALSQGAELALGWRCEYDLTQTALSFAFGGLLNGGAGVLEKKLAERAAKAAAAAKLGSAAQTGEILEDFTEAASRIPSGTSGLLADSGLPLADRIRANVAANQAATANVARGLITADLRSLTTIAASEVDRLGMAAFTPRQRLAALVWPRLQPAFRGNAIDRRVRNAVANDSFLQRLFGSPSRGPDFRHPALPRVWWDMTTEAQWPAHLKKYGPGGILLPTR